MFSVGWGADGCVTIYPILWLAITETIAEEEKTKGTMTVPFKSRTFYTSFTKFLLTPAVHGRSVLDFYSVTLLGLPDWQHVDLAANLSHN